VADPEVSGIARFNPKLLLTDGTREFWTVDIKVGRKPENLTRVHLSTPYG
jgi:hypothetical protein